MKMFRKNLCDKVSKMKNLRLLSCSFFRADRRGVLRFFGRRIFHGENRETKSPVLTFWKKAEKRRQVRGETGGKNRRKKIPRRIHLRVPSEPVVLDPQTFSIDPQKAV